MISDYEKVMLEAETLKNEATCISVVCQFVTETKDLTHFNKAEIHTALDYLAWRVESTHQTMENLISGLPNA